MTYCALARTLQRVTNLSEVTTYCWTGMDHFMTSIISCFDFFGRLLELHVSLPMSCLISTAKPGSTDFTMKCKSYSNMSLLVQLHHSILPQIRLCRYIGKITIIAKKQRMLNRISLEFQETTLYLNPKPRFKRM